MKHCILLLIAVIFTASAHADLWLPSIFSDGMVLQSGKPVPVWGEANPGVEVTVKFAGQSKRAVADSSKYWKITLDSMPISSKSRELTISSNKSTIQYTNVQLGEVWILAGQSSIFSANGHTKVSAMNRFVM